MTKITYSKHGDYYLLDLDLPTQAALFFWKVWANAVKLPEIPKINKQSQRQSLQAQLQSAFELSGAATSATTDNFGGVPHRYNFSHF